MKSKGCVLQFASIFFVVILSWIFGNIFKDRSSDILVAFEYSLFTVILSPIFLLIHWLLNFEFAKRFIKNDYILLISLNLLIITTYFSFDFFRMSKKQLFKSYVIDEKATVYEAYHDMEPIDPSVYFCFKLDSELVEKIILKDSMVVDKDEWSIHFHAPTWYTPSSSSVYYRYSPKSGRYLYEMLIDYENKKVYYSYVDF